MNFDEMIKYLIWIVFFGLVFAGVYALSKKMGLIG